MQRRLEIGYPPPGHTHPRPWAYQPHHSPKRDLGPIRTKSTYHHNDSREKTVWWTAWLLILTMLCLCRGEREELKWILWVRRGLWGGGEGSPVISKSKVFFIFIGGGRGGYHWVFSNLKDSHRWPAFRLYEKVSELRWLPPTPQMKEHYIWDDPLLPQIQPLPPLKSYRFEITYFSLPKRTDISTPSLPKWIDKVLHEKCSPDVTWYRNGSLL